MDSNDQILDDEIVRTVTEGSTIYAVEDKECDIECNKEEIAGPSHA